MKYMISSNVDELTYRLECAVQNLNVVHDAMEHGAWDLEFYTPAVFASYGHLAELVKELRQLVEEADPTPPYPRSWRG